MSWQERTLDELGYVSRGRSKHRPRDAAHLYGGDYPFIQTGDVKHSGLYLYEYSQTYSEAGLEQSKLWPEGTLCITIAANIAETSILKIPACFPDSIIGFIPEKGKADARFIKYLFDAMLKNRYKAFTQGAAQDNLSQGKLLSLKFLVPDYSVQVDIADKISAYDELIENNKRRIELLEESARQLYKEWFVRFRFPGHEHVNIFDGVPEGWKTKNIGEIALVKGGKRLPKGYALQPEPTEHPYIRVKDMAKNGLITEKLEYISDETYEKIKSYIIRADDLYISIAGTIGRVGIVPNELDGANLTENAAKIVFRWEEFYRSFILHFLNSDLGQATIASKTGGTSQPKLALSRINDIRFLCPPNALLAQFHEFISGIHTNCENLKKQNSLLIHSRDLLLPKLMSGELTV